MAGNHGPAVSIYLLSCLLTHQCTVRQMQVNSWYIVCIIIVHMTQLPYSVTNVLFVVQRS